MGGRGSASPGGKGGNQGQGKGQAKDKKGKDKDEEAGDDNKQALADPTSEPLTSQQRTGTGANPLRLNLSEESIPFGELPIELELEAPSDEDTDHDSATETGLGFTTGAGAGKAGTQTGSERGAVVAVESRLPRPPFGIISEGAGGRGRVWQKRLLDALVKEMELGQELQVGPKGYEIVRSNDKEVLREVEFYRGFEWDKLDYRLPQALGLEILRSRGLQKMLVETPSVKDSRGVAVTVTATTTLKRLWKKWERGRARGQFGNVANFTRYVGINHYRVGLDEPTPLTQAIEGWDALPHGEERARAVLQTSELDLLEKLPDSLRARVQEVLKEPNVLARSPYLEEAREPLIKRVNAALGYAIQDLAEFEAVMRAVEQEGSRGTIGETVFRRLFAGPLTGSEALRKPYFKAEWYGDASASQPDMLRPLARRLVDVKVGYSQNQVADQQLEKYVKLVMASRDRPDRVDPALSQKLQDLGVRQGHLSGHDLVFMSGGHNEARHSAGLALDMLGRKELTELVAVYYVATYSAADGTQKAGVFRLAYADEEEDDVSSATRTAVASLVGDRLAD